ncbi:ras association domain-containing protein 9-like [Coccinella septempunctata]|uniref:ras association domain-containing protein 9-like n=1 Tax=Coccinella septempunctata TaxID=41139 RepID=UPI001D08C960|nr:ras association domain-containing protein 9-like [Coccinella septempunctata]
MMWLEDNKNITNIEDSDSDESDCSTEEIPIWVRGEQRWVSGIIPETTCQEVVQVLIQNEKLKGKHIGEPEEYHITERWRGVEQPLDPNSRILDIWNAWSSAQEEIKISLRRIRSDRTCNRRMRRTDSATWSDRNSWKTLHPKRLATLQNEKEPSNTEELLKLVLAQGEVIRRQLKKLRHSEHQIGYLEDKTHRARVRKHGSNYLLETYLKGLPEAVNPEQEEHAITDKNSDSGVVTEGDSEQSNNVKKSKSENTMERFSPSSEEFVQEDIKDDDSSSTVSVSALREHRELMKKISKVNKQLLKQEECLVRLEVNLKKYEKYKNVTDDVTESLTNLRTEMAKSACEMQHNEVVLEETNELINSRRHFLENLHKDIMKEEQEHEMLQALLFSAKHQRHPAPSQNFIPHSHNYKNHNTKEMLDTLV